MLPLGKRCCCGSFGIFRVSLLRAGCLSAGGNFPCNGSLFPLFLCVSSMSELNREADYVLIVDEEEDVEGNDED